MPSLFYLPKVVSLPGSKLTFTQTGTTTPQDVYTDEDLQVAHSVPVEADLAGVFPPIYLDPTVPHYRVRYTTSADVLIYQVDDIPSNQNVQQSVSLEAANPSLLFFDTDGASNQRKYRIRVVSDSFVIESLNDAESVSFTAFTITNNTVDMNIGATLGGNAIALSLPGQFTGTYTGFSTSPTESISYAFDGDTVVLHLTGVSATSNATSMTLTGLPVAIRPGFTRDGLLCRVIDNGGTASIGTASVGTGGSITFGLGAAGGAFTGSGTKALLPTTLVYRTTNNG